MVSSRQGNLGDTGGGQTIPPTVPPVRNTGAVAVLDQIAQYHSRVQEGGGAEMTEFGGGGGKGGDLKGVQRLHVHPDI